MPRPVSSTYVEDKVRIKQEQATKEEAASAMAPLGAAQQQQMQQPQQPQQYEYPAHAAAAQPPPPPHAYPQMAYSQSYDAADPELQQQQQQHQAHHHQEFAAQQAAQQAAAAAGGFYIKPSEYAALQQAQVQLQAQFQAQQQQQQQAQAQGQGGGLPGHIDRVGSYERSSPSISAAAAAHAHHQQMAAAAAASGYPPPPAIGPSSSFGGAPTAYYPHQHPAASMSRSFSGGSSGEMLQQHQHPQQHPQPQAVVPEGYPGAFPEHYPPHPHHHPPHHPGAPPPLAHQGQGQYGPPPQYVGGPPAAPYPGHHPAMVAVEQYPGGVAASASGGASDHGGSDAGSMTSSHHSSYHQGQGGDMMNHAQAANMLVRSYSSSSQQQLQQQRPPVPPTRRSTRRGSKGDATALKQTSSSAAAAGDDSTSEQQGGDTSAAAASKSNSFKEPDNAVIDSKPVYGDSPLVKHLKKSNAMVKEQRLEGSVGDGDGDGDGDNDEDLPNPPPLEESKSWRAGPSSWIPKQSAVPIEMTDQTICCTCKKSKCLKLYCQCFASKAMCGPACRCMMCHNNPGQEKERTEAIRLILQRNPSAFEDKIGKTGASGKKDSKGHKIGCKCRKSACLKKYCECYHAGVRCSSNCRCADCKNTPDGSINNPTTGTSMAVSMNPTSAYTSQSRRMDYLPELMPSHGHPQAATSAYGVPVVTTDPAAAMAPGAFEASRRKNSSFHQSPPGLRTSRKFAVASDFVTAESPPKGSGGPKASPGDPRVIQDAALHLAFLKGSPARKEKKMSQIPDISAMPSLASSEEVYPHDDSQGQGGAAPASGGPDLSAQDKLVAGVVADVVAEVISPNSERKANDAVDALLLAASALTDLNPGSAASGAGINAPSSPPKQAKKEVISMPQGGLSDRPETPQRYARQSSQSSIARASPKRKSSFGSDCPTPKRNSSFGSQDAAMHSPDTRANQRKHIRDIEASNSTDAAMLLAVGSYSGEGDQDTASVGPSVMPPYTPPIPPKTKKTRMGTIKRGGARNVPPNPPTDPTVFDSAARPAKSHSDGEEDGSSRGSPGSNGDSSDNHEDANTEGVFRDRAATPPGRDPSDVLTPVSSRIVGLRKLHVNDSTDGGVVTGESIGMDLEGEINVGQDLKSRTIQ